MDWICYSQAVLRVMVWAPDQDHWKLKAPMRPWTSRLWLVVHPANIQVGDGAKRLIRLAMINTVIDRLSGG